MEENKCIQCGYCCTTFLCNLKTKTNKHLVCKYLVRKNSMSEKIPLFHCKKEKLNLKNNCVFPHNEIRIQYKKLNGGI